LFVANQSGNFAGHKRLPLAAAVLLPVDVEAIDTTTSWADHEIPFAPRLFMALPAVTQFLTVSPALNASSRNTTSAPYRERLPVRHVHHGPTAPPDIRRRQP
jgi:hypothetical protein